MIEPIRFFVPGIPATAGSKRHVGNGILVDSSGAKGKAWRSQVIASAQEVWPEGTEPLRDMALIMEVTFRMSRPQYHWGKNGIKPSAPPYPHKRPDTTKLLRAIEDALTGIVWHDDAQVVDQIARKRWADPTPGAEVTIKEAAP